MKPPAAPPAGLVAVPVGTGCVLLLTDGEYRAAIRRGKWWRRWLATQRRSAASHEERGSVEIGQPEPSGAAPTGRPSHPPRTRPPPVAMATGFRASNTENA